MPQVKTESIAQPRPTLWRTCRVLANKTRLRILQELLRHPDRSVSEVAMRFGLGLPTASDHLRALAARGLLQTTRTKRWVRYRVEPDMSIPEARALVQALAVDLRSSGVGIDEVYQAATAFTHPRRQAIYKAAREREPTFRGLMEATGIPAPALRRHIAKLASRGFILGRDGTLVASAPRGSTASVLAAVAPDAAC